MTKKILTTVLVVASMAFVALAQEAATYTTNITFSKNSKVLSSPRIKLVEATKGSISVEIEKEKRLGVEVVPNGSEARVSVQVNGKSVEVVVATGEESTILFSSTGYKLKDSSGKVLKTEKLKDFPSKSLSGISVTILCRRDD